MGDIWVDTRGTAGARRSEMHLTEWTAVECRDRQNRKGMRKRENGNQVAGLKGRVRMTSRTFRSSA